MKLILSLTPSVIWQELYPRISAPQINTIDSINTQTDDLVLVSSAQSFCDDKVVELLEYTEQVVVFYQQAEYSIGAAIEEGQLISDAISYWQDQVSALLNLKKKNRHKIRLVNLNQFIQHADYEKILSNILEAEINIQDYAAIDETTPYHILLAKQAVEQTELDGLNTLLFASSEVVGNALVMNFDIQKLVDETKAPVLESKNEHDKSLLLTKELVDAHEKMHLLNREIDRLNKALLSETDSKVTIQNKHAQLLLEHDSANQILQTEIQSLLQELNENAEIIERSAQVNITNSELKKQNKALQESLQKEQGINKQQHTKLHSFRVKNRKFQAEILTLNESLEKQLEETKELSKQKRALQSQSTVNQKKLQRELKKVQDELNMFKAQNAEYTHKIYNLESEIRVIKDSAVWKTSAPLRAFSNILTKHDRNKQSFQKDIALIISSPYFDAKWYLETYPDVAEANLNPAEHYLKFGAAEGRYCGPNFDPIWYIEKYPDVAESGLNPLLHYIKYGELEGRHTSPKLLEFNVSKK